MSAWRTCVVLMAAVLFHVGLGSLRRPPLQVPFDLFLVLTVFYAGSTSRVWGPVLGAIIGLLADALSTQEILGPQSFALALVGYAAGSLNALFVITSGLMKLLAVFCATFVARGTLYGLDIVLDTQSPAVFRAWDCTREAILNALVAPILMAILARWHHLGDPTSRS